MHDAYAYRIWCVCTVQLVQADELTRMQRMYTQLDLGEGAMLEGVCKGYAPIGYYLEGQVVTTESCRASNGLPHRL